MTEAVTEAEEAGDIDELRLAFKEISEHLVKALENQGYNEETLYLQYCPMADDGEGAHWVSNQEAIKNPFMGQRMPGCGITEKEINPEK